jgi:hypothetical protein
MQKDCHVEFARRMTATEIKVKIPLQLDDSAKHAVE